LVSESTFRGLKGTYRARHLQAHPPEGEWRGIWGMKTK